MSAPVVLVIASKLAKSWLTMHVLANACKLLVVKVVCNNVKDPLAFLDCDEMVWLLDDLLSTLYLF